MRLHWQNSIQVSAPTEQVYTYLADFSRPHEWANSLERMETVQEADPSGIGARYITHERVEFPVDGGWRQRIARSSTAKTMCEVRELVPHTRIAWHAHPSPASAEKPI